MKQLTTKEELQNAEPGTYVVAGDAAKELAGQAYYATIRPQLTAAPDPHGSFEQYCFEEQLTENMRINSGTLAIHPSQNRYVNDHIQWFWEQYARV